MLFHLNIALIYIHFLYSRNLANVSPTKSYEEVVVSIPNILYLYYMILTCIKPVLGFLIKFRNVLLHSTLNCNMVTKP